MKALFVGFTLVATLGVGSIATAQSFPTKSITIVVPFSAGGPTDTLARLLTEPMRKALGQTVVVENTTGAGGTIGTGRVVRSAPDGYTLSIGHWGTHVVNGAYYTKLAFHVYDDFAPVAMIATNPQLIVSRNAVPANNLKELIAWIRANEKTALMGTGGVGGASHIAALKFANMIGIKFQYVPYRGAAPVWTAMLGNEVDLFVTQVGSAINFVRAGKVRAYAVTSKNRQAVAPDIPTVDEAGLPGFHTSVWHALWAPKATPKDVIAKLNSAVVESLKDPLVSKRFIDLGQEIPPLAEQTPAALAAHHKKEIAIWWPIIKEAGLQAD